MELELEFWFESYYKPDPGTIQTNMMGSISPDI